MIALGNWGCLQRLAVAYYSLIAHNLRRKWEQAASAMRILLLSVGQDQPLTRKIVVLCECVVMADGSA